MKKKKKGASNIDVKGLLGLQDLPAESVGGAVVRGLELTLERKRGGLEVGDLALLLHVQQGQRELVSHLVSLVSLAVIANPVKPRERCQ